MLDLERVEEDHGDEQSSVAEGADAVGEDELGHEPVLEGLEALTQGLLALALLVLLHSLAGLGQEEEDRQQRNEVERA
jgi:hypothetical protein